MAVATAAPLLEVRGLQTHFSTSDGLVRAVDGVDLEIRPGQVLGVVGESGCGKSVTALSIMRLLAAPAGRIAGGQVLFEGRDLVPLPDAEMNRVRGARISMVFQEPMTSLNPLHTIGQQIGEVIRVHRHLDPAETRARVLELLQLVGLRDAEQRLAAYPHELSGGQRQRVMIAIALANEPDLLIADEPTTALDVTTQAQILALIRHLQSERQMGVLFITHDFGVVAEIADKVAVMQHGRIVELGSKHQVLEAPLHDYTRRLIAAVPTRVAPNATSSALRARSFQSRWLVASSRCQLLPSSQPAAEECCRRPATTLARPHSCPCASMIGPRVAASTPSQSPGRSCRNNRAVGYQGVSSRSNSQRQSGANGSMTQHGFPRAPAR